MAFPTQAMTILKPKSLELVTAENFDWVIKNVSKIYVES